MRRIMLVVAELVVIVVLAIAVPIWLGKRPASTPVIGEDSRTAGLERLHEPGPSGAQDPLRALSARIKAIEARLQDPGKAPAGPAVTTQTIGADLDALRARIEALENATDESSFQSLANRLKIVETKLREDVRPAGGAVASAPRDTDHLRQGIDDLQRIAREQSIRIKALEDDRPRAGGGGFANEWQDVRRTVEQLSRTADDLKARLAQLERSR